MTDSEGGKGNIITRLYRALLNARWFYAVSASTVATILGISLTFGINSCRENRRVKKELRESLVQAINNLEERFADSQEWMEIINSQNRIYQTVDSINREGEEIPEDLCIEFKSTIPFVKISAFDHEFEKIFRGSYEMWQHQSQSDSLVYYISQCYDGLNIVERTCDQLTESMVEKLGEINVSENYFRLPPREWTLALINNPGFQYYMSTRRVKAAIASAILEQAKNDFDTNVITRSKFLRKEDSKEGAPK